jgi:hypothetical protein
MSSESPRLVEEDASHPKDRHHFGGADVDGALPELVDDRILE